MRLVAVCVGQQATIFVRRMLVVFFSVLKYANRDVQYTAAAAAGWRARTFQLTFALPNANRQQAADCRVARRLDGRLYTWWRAIGSRKRRSLRDRICSARSSAAAAAATAAAACWQSRAVFRL